MADRRYCAFISYRHADNTEDGRRWAEWLHEALEKYDVPPDLIGSENSREEPVPATLFPVFRDEVELPADADLSDSIRRALEASGTLIVLCSPRAVESRFVDEEIRLFKEMGRADRILALIIDGEPNADDLGKRAAGLDPKSECFPNALRHGVTRPDGTIDWTVRTEPIAADVRPGNRPGQGCTTSESYGITLRVAGKKSEAESARLAKAYAGQLRLAFLKIVAGIIGVPTGILTKRDEERRREKRRQLGKIVGGVAAALLALGGFAWFKSHQQQRLLADAARADVVSARSAWDDRKAPAAALAHLARALRYVPQHPTAESYAIGIAKSAMQFDSRLDMREHTDGITSAVYSPDGRRILTTSKDGSARLWEAEFGTQLRLLESAAKPMRGGVFSPDGRTILTFTEDLSPRHWDTATGKPLHTLVGHTAGVTTGAFSPDGQTILTGSEDGTVRVWEVASGRELRVLDIQQGSIIQTVYSLDARRILIGTRRGLRQIWNAGSLSEAPWEVPYDAERKERFVLNWPAFSPDGRMLLAAASPSAITLWDLELRKSVASAVSADVIKAEFSPDGRHVLTIPEHEPPRVWSVPRLELRRTLTGHRYDVVSGAFSPDGLRIATGGWDWTVRLWDLWPDVDPTDSANLSRTVLYSHRHPVTSISFSPDGRSLLSASHDHITRQWDAVPGGSMDTPWVLQPKNLVESSLDFIFYQGRKEQEANLLPGWFPDFLTWLGGARLDAEGEVQQLSLAERDQLRKRLEKYALSQERDRYLYLLRWTLMPPSERALGYLRATTRKQVAQDFIFLQTQDPPEAAHDFINIHPPDHPREPPEPRDARTAYWLDPAHPLIHLVLATYESDKVAADFLRRYSLDRLPDDSLLQLVAAEILIRQKQPAWALGYVERVLWHLQDPEQVRKLGQPASGMQQEAARLRATLRSELQLPP